MKVEKGDAGGTKSIVDTQYVVCACSAVGKLWRVSQPYAPGGVVYWTTYTYDALGRTLSVAHPDNPDFLIPGSSGLEKMSSACVNLWQSWVVSAEALAGRVKDPFAGKGVTTSFHLNTTPSAPLETYFGNAGLASSFFGIVPPPPAVLRGRESPMPREPGRQGRRR